MVTVVMSIRAKSGKWMTQEVPCLRPHVGEDILLDQDQFRVDAVALHVGQNTVVVKVTPGDGKRLSERALREMGFMPDDD